MSSPVRNHGFVHLAGGVIAALLLGPRSSAVGDPWMPSLETATDPVAHLDHQIAQALATIERSETRKAQLEAEADHLEQRNSAADDRVRVRTRALYGLTRPGKLPLAGGFSALLAHVSRVQRMKRLLKGDAEALRSLKRRSVALRAETSELAQDITKARETLSTLQQRKDVLAEEERMAEIFDGAFGGNGQAGSSPWVQTGYGGAFRVHEDVTLDGADPSSPAEPEAPFLAQRGRLVLPVIGAADIREGQRGGNQGLEFVVSPETRVRCAADGSVVHAAAYRDYGELVIVEHGDRFYTVYGGMGVIDVAVGDSVSRGARLGSVGNQGLERGLFFEVRRGTRALDALSWLGL